MLKQSSNGMRKVLAILLVGLFVASLTAVAAVASQHGGEHGGGHGGGHGRYGGYGGYGDWGGYGSYTGCGWVNGAWVCPAYGYPYIWTWKYATWSHGNSIWMKTKTAKDKIVNKVYGIPLLEYEW